MNTQLAEITNPPLGGLGTKFAGAGGGVSFLQAFLQAAITILFTVGFLYFMFQFITGGIDWIRAGADKASLEAARSKLLNAGVGIVLLLSAFAVFTLIKNIFGIDLLLLTIPTLT